MLVLSRQVGESIVIGDSIVITLAVAGSAFAEFSVVDSNTAARKVVTVDAQHRVSIADEVTVVFVGPKKPNGVRMGIERPQHIEVQRVE